MNDDHTYFVEFSISDSGNEPGSFGVGTVSHCKRYQDCTTWTVMLYDVIKTLSASFGYDIAESIKERHGWDIANDVYTNAVSPFPFSLGSLSDWEEEDEETQFDDDNDEDDEELENIIGLIGDEV
jgi:hypothetical protein